MRHLNMAIVLLHVLEALQVQRQDHGQLLHAHPLLGLLVAAAVVALELVIAAQRLRVAEAAQAVRDGRVLVHVHLQVEEVLVLAAHRLAVQAARLTREDALEYLVHERGLRLALARLYAHARERSVVVVEAVVGRSWLLARVPFGQNDFVNVVDQEVEELVRVLLHVVVELLLLLPQARNELLRGDRAHLLLLRRDAVEQVGQACEQRLFGALVLGLVVQDLVPERLAEVERLQH